MHANPNNYFCCYQKDESCKCIWYDHWDHFTFYWKLQMTRDLTHTILRILFFEMLLATMLAIMKYNIIMNMTNLYFPCMSSIIWCSLVIVVHLTHPSSCEPISLMLQNEAYISRGKYKLNDLITCFCLSPLLQASFIIWKFIVGPCSDLDRVLEEAPYKIVILLIVAWTSFLFAVTNTNFIFNSYNIHHSIWWGYCRS